MDTPDHVELTLREAARQFEISEREMQHLVQRGAVEASFRDGQWWVRLGPRDGEDPIARLWHGTSKDRADVIVEQGFWPETAGKQVWLTTSELSARRHAIGRARRRGGRPVLLECRIDLQKYPLFWRRSPLIYVFHQPLGAEVITSMQEIDEREESRHYRMGMERKARGEPISVGVTKTSGALGILFWINAYLEQYGRPPVTEDHQVVRDVIAWVTREYDEGRDGPIADEELAARVAPLLPAG